MEGASRRRSRSFEIPGEGLFARGREGRGDLLARGCRQRGLLAEGGGRKLGRRRFPMGEVVGPGSVGAGRLPKAGGWGQRWKVGRAGCLL
ncbi:hypothetical protein TIFTF001_045940 [Ficus carica]|uniref:Uncharacterized protein n=1 Tax=Ficus carica TaxID=3494 RepID=A0AA87ZFI7_FICCA|nr:hypothetical protein TIFTF001_045937 [Ficus carica]GMN25348.1 hypothetical protein TIFTF001_045938 [Ficus carica]GMN25360.1 hypothetical protein TIFTF001_045939 [Ficus carica]GMN25374.1 hypothetical protein TIFTF001_045940 [Ficus carica]